jgi:hypothetical protein
LPPLCCSTVCLHLATGNVFPHPSLAPTLSAPYLGDHCSFFGSVFCLLLILSRTIYPLCWFNCHLVIFPFLFSVLFSSFELCAQLSTILLLSRCSTRSSNSPCLSYSDLVNFCHKSCFSSTIMISESGPIIVLLLISEPREYFFLFPNCRSIKLLKAFSFVFLL